MYVGWEEEEVILWKADPTSELWSLGTSDWSVQGNSVLERSQGYAWVRTIFCFTLCSWPGVNFTDRTSVLHVVVLTMYGVDVILSGLCASRAHTSIYFFFSIFLVL